MRLQAVSLLALAHALRWKRLMLTARSSAARAGAVSPCQPCCLQCQPAQLATHLREPHLLHRQA